jgi:hypothetical protein
MRGNFHLKHLSLRLVDEMKWQAIEELLFIGYFQAFLRPEDFDMGRTAWFCKGLDNGLKFS